MKSVCVFLTAWLFVLSCPLPQSAADKEFDAELRWAKRVATEFFNASLSTEESGDFVSSPAGLLSPELAAAMKEEGENAINKLLWQYQGGQFRIKSAEAAPSKCEVILTTELIPSAGPREPKPKTEEEAFGIALATALLGPKQENVADVTVWMAKDRGGRWVIRFIRAKVRKEAGK